MNEQRCDFCGRAATDVDRLIAGKEGGRICPDCIERVVEINADFAAGEPQRTAPTA